MTGSLGEDSGALRLEHVVDEPRLDTSIRPSAYAPQPFPIDEMSACAVEGDGSAFQMCNGSAIFGLSGGAFSEQGPGSGCPAKGGFGCAGLCSLVELAKHVGRDVAFAAVRGGFDHLSQEVSTHTQIVVLQGSLT
ncbi:MAG TPA: hypothetical protein VI029_05905, partial [Mycobacterium sp.]